MVSSDQPFYEQLQKVKQLYEQTKTTRETVRDELGVDVSALRSVPAAIYTFLKCLQPVDDLRKLDKGNPFSRTILYAISLGGDTDTIASMAGAIAGAYYGIESIPKVWQEKCEGVKEAKRQAEQLHKLASTL